MKNILKKGLFLLALTLTMHVSLGAFTAHAQTTTDNLAAVGDQSGLGSTDIKITIANLIRTGLSFLGVIAVCIVLYGGYVWMTAGGDAEKVERAKKILINAAVGLVIILMSWAITTFIITSILTATGGGTGGTGGGGGGGPGGMGGGTSPSLFEVRGISPEGVQTIRNIQVQATFTHPILESSAAQALSLVNATTGSAVSGTVSVSGRRVTFVPSTTCPSPNEDRFCFDENTSYTVTVDPDIESTSGLSLTCTSESCSGSFTSGTLIDTEDPRALMTAPDDHDAIAADSSERAEVQATDDAGVAVADFSVDGEIFESVPASGDDFTDVVIESIWDTTGLTVGQKYEVAVVVTDVAGNTDNDAVTVTARPATCFNGTQDSDKGETGIDCGGDTSSASYCGACDGSSCTDSSFCGGSSSCEDGVCSDLPIISGISPDNGAVGTFVTVSGTGFGNSEGTVYFFTSSGSKVAAALVSCSDGWSDTQVIVIVPEGAVDGPLSLMTSGGDEDYTNDTEGELVPDFDVNDTERPSLCSIAPDSAMVADAVVLSGRRFGSSRGSSVVVFGDGYGAGSYTSWADDSITATVPSVRADDYTVAVTVDGVESNLVAFSVTDEDVADAPNIVSINPGSGGVGQYITIAGSSFGNALGSVWFENNETGDRTLASVDFPDSCSESIWSDTEITVIVPDVATGKYSVSVESRSGESSQVAFTITDADPTPGLCGISPESGNVGDAVTLYGDNFGSTSGSVHFAGSVTGTVTAWSKNEIAVTVPSSAQTGSVTVVNSTSAESNGITFTVGSGSSSASSGASAAYAWSFSSGIIPEVPEIVVACSDDTVSAVPNDQFTQYACVDVPVYVEFTVPMNEATLSDALLLEKCTASGDRPCSSTAPVAGGYTTTATSVTFLPTSDLDVSTMYQVTVSTKALSAEGSALAKDVVWTFTTKGDSSACEVERVILSPSSKTLESEGATQEFSALPIADCTVLNADDFTWEWGMSASYARFSGGADDCSGGSSSCATVEALAEGTTQVTGTERASKEVGTADLTINFSDPYVVRYFPDCTEACTNATVGASFNIPMKKALVESGVGLYLCDNELCTAKNEIDDVSASCTLNEDGECMGFTLALPGAGLTAGKYYRVVLSGDVTSTSGVPLIRTNYGGDFSWMFRVRQDGTVCAVDRVTISPATAQSNEVGDQKVFTASAYGEADSCSVSGQLLDAYSYSWTWTDPIADENNDDNAGTVVAGWTGSSFADTDPLSVAKGCSASCTSLGSTPHAAICGDGYVNTGAGEECEDGNVSDDDGCSSSCLREGSYPVAYTCSEVDGPCTGLYDETSCADDVCVTTRLGCGDGNIDEFEDCDDGNIDDGDGCSSSCLAEGSSSVGSTCGNSDVAYNAKTYAGEECDDGNALNNDGCSADCTHEGSPTATSFGDAVCGDGLVDAPYESCDDGNTSDDDGCSSVCLYEGSSLSYAVPSTCGNGGALETGEECDDANTKNGDGCSSRCILEGSSASYEAPSYCGDGVVGEGEVALCESGAGGDGKIDPVQVAAITRTAVFEVDDSGKAVATIESTESSEDSSSTLTAQASWTLFCAATSDDQCSDSVTQGVGVGNCCMDRPLVSFIPNGTESVCRNASLYGIFTQPMDLSTFTYTNESGEASYRMYAALDLTSVADGVCPSTHTTLAQAPSGFFARVWLSVKRIIFGKNALASAGDCVVPIESFSQEEQADGSYRVYMHTNSLLAANGLYSFIVEGDDSVSDGVASGVRSDYGVSLYGNSTQAFTVGGEICAVDEVSVSDDDAQSPGVFSSLADSHAFSAAAISYVTGTPQEIEPISGVYDWTWSSWETDNDTIFDVSQDTSGSSNTATVVPAGSNGTANVVATLTIGSNTAGIETDSEVSGYSEATALLCENPWPAIASYPWADDEDHESVGATKGIGWTNFSLGYCRDAGESGTSDDLPALSVVSPVDTRDDAILKEYLLQVQGTSDALGIRIASNSDYLSPSAWYAAQGFTGTPSETTVDGFPAVEDGRTLYVAAPNLDDSGNYLYSNMYIISYNNDAGDDAATIYAQVVEHLTFGTNLSSVGYCSNGSSYSTLCSSDLDCAVDSGESCADIRGKVARDTKRLADMTDMRSRIQTYGDANGYCSETTSQSCSSSGDCPGGESCEPAVPTLSSGTFVRALASSVWGSWDSILGGALEGDIGSDPLNAYEGCGQDPFAAYDAETCVDQEHGEYLCPEHSYAYHYRAYGSGAAYIAADLEYGNADWFYPIDEDGADDGVDISIGGSSAYASGFTSAAFCDGVTTYGGSSTCGDGLIGSGERCEVGESGGSAVACDADSDGIDDGYINQICNSTCTDFEDNPSATCTPTTCGDGIVAGDEACDDGTANGRYGYCGSDCAYTSAVFCGDGKLSGGEMCDCGDSDVFSGVPSSGRAYGASSLNSCTAFNGVYTASPSASCAWDCSGAASYCGDGEVTGSEQCDGADDTWSGELCYGGTDAGDECTDDSQCSGGVCGGSGVYAACETGFTRVMPCDDDSGASCTYTSNWTSLSCTEIGSCGDGVVDPDEECDDGNDDGTDSCTTECTTNVCGDGYLYSGEEECDEGTLNGTGCDASYGSTCSACTTSCRQLVSSGAFCGDGVINGDEYCDGSDLPYQYVDYSGGVVTTHGSCDPGSDPLTIGTTTYTCRKLGMCDGGPDNGEYCTASSLGISAGDDAYACSSNGFATVSCIYPSCADSCASSCPLTETTASLLMTPNLPGSSDSSSADIYSYASSTTSDLPNAVTITMPACTVAGTLTGSIDMSNVDLPDVYVAFVTDRSGSMGDTLGSGTRMSVARSLLESSVGALFDGLGGSMHIGLVGYSSDAGTGICNDSNINYTYSCNADDDCHGSTKCENQFTDTFSSDYGFGQTTDESTLLSRISEFVDSGSTHTGDALTEAKTILDAVPNDGNVRKIVVLLSDGQPSDDPDASAEALKDAGYEVYTVALVTSTDTDLITAMNGWSSNSGAEQNDNGIDYAYDGDTASELESAYDSIINSILGVTVSVVSSGSTGVELTSDIVTEGNNLSLPWPENFTCDPESDQEVPLQITFLGEGTVKLSNLRIEYCAP